MTTDVTWIFKGYEGTCLCLKSFSLGQKNCHQWRDIIFFITPMSSIFNWWGGVTNSAKMPPIWNMFLLQNDFKFGLGISVTNSNIAVETHSREESSPNHTLDTLRVALQNCTWAYVVEMRCPIFGCLGVSARVSIEYWSIWQAYKIGLGSGLAAAAAAGDPYRNGWSAWGGVPCHKKLER